MKDIEFNLIDEPWIRVIDNNCELKEVSLKDVLLNAHKYTSLSGELPTQDAAVMRIILAVLYAVFSRTDENGIESPAEDEDMYCERWTAILEKGHFPQKPITDYLNKWYDRFWLFHPEYPFMQCAKLTYGTLYEASKLNGEISESSNKLRMFSSYSGKAKNELSYSQAARWLPYLNGYDDTSGKPSAEGKKTSTEKMGSPGCGWLGKLGLVWITGNNLFETLMFNMVSENEDFYENELSEKPIWENDDISFEERRKIVFPDNLAELYTLRSRIILIKRENDAVTGYRLLGGDYFDKESAYPSEPMTVWAELKESKSSSIGYTPRRHDPSKQMWREFSSYFCTGGNPDKEPGVIKWNRKADELLCNDDRVLYIKIASVLYGDKDFFVSHVFGDSITLHTKAVSDPEWYAHIINEIKFIQKTADVIYNYSREIYISSGGNDNRDDYGNFCSSIKEQFYDRIDIPFREWLASITPDIRYEDKVNEWRNTAEAAAISLAEEIADNAGEAAIIGHKVKSKDKERLYNSPKALLRFRAEMKKYREGVL